MQRVARALVGTRADPERFGAALAASLFLLLGLAISWNQPWTSWAAVVSAYYFTVPLVALVLEDRPRRPPRRRIGLRLLDACLLAGLLFILYPTAVSGELTLVLDHAVTFFFAGVVLGGVVTAIWARPATTREP